MARRMTLLHIGRPLTGVDRPHDTLFVHSHLLAGAGVMPAPVTTGDLDRAATELLRAHRDAGLRRRDVEGAWAAACRRIHRDRRHLVLSQPRFADATDEQVALLLDGLAGREVHVAVTAPADDAEMNSVASLWAARLRSGHVHRLPLDEHAEPIDLAEQLAGLALCLGRRPEERRSLRWRRTTRRTAGRHRAARLPLAG